MLTQVKQSRILKIGFLFLISLLVFFTFVGIFNSRKHAQPKPSIVVFSSGNRMLHGIIYKPEGSGPFPGLLYNHGSAAGMVNDRVSRLLGPLFANHGWVFFMPYRRGQGLSMDAGSYILDEADKVRKSSGTKAAFETIARILVTDHLNDQLAAFAWLKNQNFIQKNHVAVMGDSFGGIETVLGAEKISYCAAVDVSGAAKIWNKSPTVQKVMIDAVRKAQVPIFFFQTENDYNLSPNRVLSTVMKESGKPYQVKIYPPFGDQTDTNHSFAYLGSSIWSDDVFIFLNKYCLKKQ